MAAGSQLAAPPGSKIGCMEGPNLQNRSVASPQIRVRIHLPGKSSNKMESLAHLASQLTTSNLQLSTSYDPSNPQSRILLGALLLERCLVAGRERACLRQMRQPQRAWS